MLSSEKLAIAAHLLVLLRRKTGRVTDTEWMASNTEYATEIVRFARVKAQEDGHPEPECDAVATLAHRPSRPCGRTARMASSMAKLICARGALSPTAPTVSGGWLTRRASASHGRGSAGDARRA